MKWDSVRYWTAAGHLCVIGCVLAGASYLSQYELLLGTTYGAIGGGIVGLIAAAPLYRIARRASAQR